MYLKLASYVVVGVACIYATWTFQTNKYERLLSEQRTEYATAQVKAVEKANATTIKLQAKADSAAKQHASRQAALANDIASTRSALIGLSDAADSALRAANDSHSTCQRIAITSTELLQQCSVKYRDMAEVADDWNNEAIMLRNSWPSVD